MLKLNDFTPRRYQETLFSNSTTKNSLIVLPTGLGKTAIAMMLAVHRLNNFPNSKIVFFAPTKPLADQHLNSFKKHINLKEEEMVLFTGSIKPEKRKKLWETAKIIFSTPQGFENDVISGRINFKDVSLAIFDEAHRAVKDYSYVFLAKKYRQQTNNERILALTASPGSRIEVITEVINNLSIENIELKRATDLDVKEYVQETNIEWLKIELPEEIKKLKKYLEDAYNKKLETIQKLGYLTGSISSYNKGDILKLQSALFAKAQNNPEFELLKSISLLAEAGKIEYAIELVETQSLYALLEYLKKLEEQSKNSKTKAVKNLVRDPNFIIAKKYAKQLLDKKIEHPKLKKLQSLSKLYLDANKESKIIIFTQFRDTAQRIKEFLDKKEIKSETFFGQSKKKGIGHSQKQQKQIIENFKKDKFQVLIATSVAEEGLDIPSVDLVIFYETIPSAIRTVQRRGRTGRHKKGRIITLITKGTRDEIFRWVSKNKEKRMYNVLENYKKKHSLRIKPEKRLQDFKPKRDLSNIKIFADYREKGSQVLRYLSKTNISLKLDTLNSGDYLVSNKCAIEFKTVEDFVNSIIDKRIFEQAKNLSKQYEKKILIIQGQEDIYSVRRIHPNAIRGVISTLILNYGIAIIYSKTPIETAELLISFAKREQEENKNALVKHSAKPLTLKEQQEFIVSSLPGIGTTLNKPLLKEFGSIKNIVNAKQDELMKINLIGKIKAEKLYALFNQKYKNNK
jgi:Fanconi anemia group M protein